jgi:hypothetical protein
LAKIITPTLDAVVGNIGTVNVDEVNALLSGDITFNDDVVMDKLYVGEVTHGSGAVSFLSNLIMDTAKTILTDTMAADTIAARASGPITFDDEVDLTCRAAYVRTTELVSFTTSNTEGTTVALADKPYQDVRIDGTWGGGSALWHLQLSINAANVAYGAEYYVTVRGDSSSAGGVDIEFVPVSGVTIVTDSGDPSAPLYDMPASAGERTATFRLFCAAIGGVGATPGGKVVYVQRIGQRNT